MSVLASLQRILNKSKPFGIASQLASKRLFLKSSLVMLAGMVLHPKRVLADARHPEWTMIVDVNRCIGCQSCVIACKAQNDTAEGNFNTRVLTAESSLPPAYTFMPVMCNQCENAPCVRACPREATFRRKDGIVVTDWNRCDGSGDCIAACPYNARSLDSTHGNRSDKCDFCLDRLEQGLAPACVEACASGARVFGDAANPVGEMASYLRRQNLKVHRSELNLRGRVFYVPLDRQIQRRRN